MGAPRPPPPVDWSSAPDARRHSVKPSWSLPKPLLARVAEQAKLAGVRPGRWARVALELADPTAVAARLAEQDAAPSVPSPPADAPSRRRRASKRPPA